MHFDPVTLTQALVRCPSVTPLDAGALDVLVQFLEPLGFRCHKLRFDDQGLTPIDNLYARFGTGAPHLCFAGHTDVVPAGDVAGWKHDPFGGVIDDGVIYGRGTSDMKGGVAASVAAAANFLHVNPDFKGSISFLITGDEEADAVNGTVKVLEWMKQNNEIPDHCVIPESTCKQQFGDIIKIGSRGSLQGFLTVRGRQGHVALSELADNPLPRLVRMLAALKAEPMDQGGPHYPPSNIEITRINVDNTANNVIPAEGHAHFNIRFNDNFDETSLVQWIRSKLDPYGAYELQTHLSAVRFLTEPGDFTAMMQQAVQKVIGVMPVLAAGGGTSDARFVQNYCPVLEFGPFDTTIHKVDECAAVEDIIKLTDIYEEVLVRYFAA